MGPKRTRKQLQTANIRYRILVCLTVYCSNEKDHFGVTCGLWQQNTIHFGNAVNRRSTTKLRIIQRDLHKV